MVDILICILFILMIGWIAVFLFFLIGVIYENAQERRFFNAVCETVYIDTFILDKCTESIKNSYDVYRRNRLITTSIPIIDICQEFAVDMRNGKHLDCFQIKRKSELANRVECVIEQLREEERFDDEKAREIITELEGKISIEVLEKIKRNLTFLEAYHKGVISTKNAEIKDIKNKMQTKKGVSWITGILGVIGSIASIISLVIVK